MREFYESKEFPAENVKIHLELDAVLMREINLEVARSKPRFSKVSLCEALIEIGLEEYRKRLERVPKIG